MEQRDLLKDQIEQLGKVLAQILSDFLGLKSKGNATQGIEISNERLQEELDLNVELLITLDKKSLTLYIQNLRLSASHLETLSRYLAEIAQVKEATNRAQSKLYLEKAIELLDLADDSSKTLSFDRINQRNKYKENLNNE